jgi:hypothetical protein
MKALHMISLALACAQPLAMAAAPAWPEVALPPGASSYSIGQQVSVDGLPMQMQGFTSSAPLSVTADWFRQHMDKPLMENHVGDKLVLGRARDSFYITIQLEQTPGGTRGIVSVSDFKAALIQRAATAAARERVLSRFPSGTRVLTAMASTDAARSSSYVALANHYSEDVNRQRVLDMLREDGMVLEREEHPGAGAVHGLPAGAAGGRALFFKGRGREAIAVISRAPDSSVTVVLNTITTMEHFK